jgi:hypothetical protein
MRPEYTLCLQVSTYLKYQYPNVIFHFDLTGLSLTKTQAGQNKAIQNGSGYPDLFIAVPKHQFSGLFIELKAEGVRLNKMNGEFASEHIERQFNYLRKLRDNGYEACFAIGFNQAKEIIDNYLRK